MKGLRQVVVAMIILSSCFCVKTEALSQGNSIAKIEVFDKIVFDNSQRKDLYTYIVNLKAGSINALKLVLDEYEKLFITNADGNCDSAYVMLEDFAMINLDATNFNYPLLKIAADPRSSKEKQAGEKYKLLLEENYYKLYSTATDIIILPDFQKIRKRVGGCLSESSKLFFEQVEKESDLIYMRNDSLIISWHELAERTLFWNKFAIENSNNLYIQEAVNRLEMYIETLVFGTSNTRICSSDGMLKEEVKQAYEMVLNKSQSGSRANEVLKKYVKILKGEKNICNNPYVLGFTF